MYLYVLVQSQVVDVKERLHHIRFFSYIVWCLCMLHCPLPTGPRPQGHRCFRLPNLPQACLCLPVLSSALRLLRANLAQCLPSPGPGDPIHGSHGSCWWTRGRSQRDHAHTTVEVPLLAATAITCCIKLNHKGATRRVHPLGPRWRTDKTDKTGKTGSCLGLHIHSPGPIVRSSSFIPLISIPILHVG